jgi:hypothetical protein
VRFIARRHAALTACLAGGFLFTLTFSQDRPAKIAAGASPLIRLRMALTPSTSF